ncbi:HNH endonuclease signature motif containing protein [Amycolatopsis thermoflava]|uniref:HNH endonuclease signature motif containing protein n=1 Tax=Amycolatopsis thermoflava TaxID=84480 RepID=UPI003EBB8FE2
MRQRVLREESTCWICGKTVDKSLSGLHPAGPVVDHIQPISAGGDPYERSNLHLAHRFCNWSKGSQYAHPQNSRDW